MSLSTLRICAFSLLLSLPVLVWAGTETPSSGPSLREMMCDAYGEHVSLLASARDKGMRLPAALKIVRQNSTTSGERRGAEAMVAALYGPAAQTTPLDAKRLFVTRCQAVGFDAMMSGDGLAHALVVSPPLLTKQERSCQAVGQIAQLIAEARDRGALLTDTLTTFRGVNRSRPDFPAWTERLNTAIAYDLYGSAVSCPPLLARQRLEALCLTQGLAAVFALYGLTP